MNSQRNETSDKKETEQIRIGNYQRNDRKDNLEKLKIGFYSCE